MVLGNFEELEEKLSSCLPAIALETGGLVTETSQDTAIVLRTREDPEKDHPRRLAWPLRMLRLLTGRIDRTERTEQQSQFLQ